ncbi:hypothetical protein CALCODRAFT_533728 [Calocera cornea HHB12733]|uniref:Uncharacterized protein n=1 Tax=Calocera cornea HHB12733 TaxID=1353952 RepID=A0A165K3K5_9BASI|nr:hypothetical protein CALCODRAFT_533728 [Calocera cornea HHB12733]
MLGVHLISLSLKQLPHYWHPLVTSTRRSIARISSWCLNLFKPMSMTEGHPATPRVSWESPLPRDFASPPRKYQRAGSDEVIDATGGSSPLEEESTVGTQSSTKAGTSDTAVEDEVVEAEDARLCGHSDEHDKYTHAGRHVGSVAPLNYRYLNVQLPISEALSMAVMVGNICMVLTSDAIARLYGLDPETEKWREITSCPANRKVMVGECLPATVALQQDGVTITLPSYANNDNGSTAPTSSLTVFRADQLGATPTLTSICTADEVLLASEGGWTVSQKVSSPDLIVCRLGDEKCVYLEGCPETRLGRMTATIAGEFIWVVNYDFACIEGYRLWNAGDRSLLENPSVAPISPLIRVDMDDAIFEARFEVLDGRRYLAVRYQYWITLYQIEQDAAGRDDPLIPVWIFDFSTSSSDETPYIADFTFVLESGLMFFLDQSRHRNHASSLKAIGFDLASKPSADNCSSRDEAWVVAEGGPEDLLQHIDHLRYEEGGHSLILGRKNSYLWILMRLERVTSRPLPITLQAVPGCTRSLTVRTMRENINWQREWRLKTSRLRASPGAIAHSVPPLDDLKFHHVNLLTGEALIGYWTDWVAQPWGDHWVLQYGSRLNVPVELLAVCSTSYMSCAVVEARFSHGSRFFRLDRYYEEDDIQQSIALRFWNQKSWQDCLSESTAGSPDDSHCALDFDALLSEEAAELDRQQVASALQVAQEESPPSPELLGAWLRLGFAPPGDPSNGEDGEGRDEDLIQMT